MAGNRVLPASVKAHLACQGAASRGVLLQLGCTDNDLRRWVRQGLLMRVRGGVYTEARDDRLLPLLRGAVAAGRDVVVSHRSAATLHTLPLWSKVRPEVTRSPGGARLSGVLVHRYGVVPDDVVEIEGLPVTSLPRTMVDICRIAAIPQALVSLDAAIARDPEHRYRALEVLDSLGDINFAKRARQCLTWADGLSETPLESFSRGHLLIQGIPYPLLQWWVGDGSVQWYRPDKLWPEWGLIGEADGRAKYEVPDALWNEKMRQEWLEERDFRFLRYGTDRLRVDAAGVAARWRQLQDLQMRSRWRWPSGVWLVEPGPWPGSRASVVNRAPLQGEPIQVIEASQAFEG